MAEFILDSTYKPKGAQPKAIDALVTGIKNMEKYQTLLGVTGSGKTFTIANVIEAVQKPTLIMSHNKTLAAQLYGEFKQLFPKNAVEYFISYYDYYQPEAYLPVTDTFIEKESSVNEEIDKLRLKATSSLMTREDVIVISSVSCIYGLGSPEEQQKGIVKIIRPGIQHSIKQFVVGVGGTECDETCISDQILPDTGIYSGLRKPEYINDKLTYKITDFFRCIKSTS